MTADEKVQWMAAVFRQAVMALAPKEADRDYRWQKFINTVQAQFVKIAGPLPPPR